MVSDKGYVPVTCKEKEKFVSPGSLGKDSVFASGVLFHV